MRLPARMVLVMIFVKVSIVCLTLAQSQSPLSTAGRPEILPALTTLVTIENRESTADCTSVHVAAFPEALYETVPPEPPAVAGPVDNARFFV